MTFTFMSDIGHSGDLPCRVHGSTCVLSLIIRVGVAYQQAAASSTLVYCHSVSGNKKNKKSIIVIYFFHKPCMPFIR